MVQERLRAFAERLVHDPTLRLDPAVDADTLCGLAGGMQPARMINLSGPELALLSALNGPTPLGELAAATGLAVADVVAIVRELVSRNLVTLRAPVRPFQPTLASGGLTAELNAAG